MWPKATLRMFTQAKSSFRILLDAIITHLLINHCFGMVCIIKSTIPIKNEFKFN